MTAKHYGVTFGTKGKGLLAVLNSVGRHVFSVTPLKIFTQLLLPAPDSSALPCVNSLCSLLNADESWS